jgi:cGMP-dependent protein kinase
MTFQKHDIIIKNGNKNTDFYLIAKGRVKMKDPITKKTLRIYDEGNCFGELSILNETVNSNNFISSEYTICYIINTNDFFELLKEQSANDYLKSKMLLEDNDISLNDLYYISYLGRGRFGNVCLVHNKICFYAAKAVSRLAAEKQKTGVKNLVNEKKTMITLDHPFVVKLVKTLKINNWCFLLEEYIPGQNFGEYLEQRKHKENIYETKFFGANLFEIISYLNKRKIIHRDIKPSNIMLDSNGYLKLIDFGTSRKLKNYSETVIGTPNFIAPEILLGKGYSFPCDYWSIGVCIFYIFFGTLPFGNKAIELFDIYKEIIEQEPDYPNEADIEIRELIDGLLCKKASLRINSLDKVQQQIFFKDFPWEDLKKMKIKPFYIPHKDHRDSIENLNMIDSPFILFMDNEKFETIQMQTLKISNKNNVEIPNSVDTKWFDDF